MLLNAALLLSVAEHGGYNDGLDPERFVPRTDGVMVSETGRISELLLGMPDVSERDYLFDIQLTMIQSALSQGIGVRIYPTVHEYPRRLDRHLRSVLDGRIPANLTLVTDYFVDTIWMRDYGPAFVRRNGTLEVIDMDYFRRRPRDDVMNYHYALATNRSLRHVHLASEGGNILSNGYGICIVSDVIFDFNFSEETTKAGKARVMRSHMENIGCPYTIVVPAMSGDATGHADMYVSWATNTTLLVGVYSEEQDPENHAVVSNAVEELGRVGRGLFVVVTMPMPDCGKCTWTNHVHVGNRVIVPVYENEDAEVQDAVLRLVAKHTKKGVVPVFADDLVKWNGVFHCITKTRP